MTCHEWTELIADYFDGDMVFAKRRNFLIHRNACSSCREYLAAYKSAIRLAGEAFADDAEPRTRHCYSIVENVMRACFADARCPL